MKKIIALLLGLILLLGCTAGGAEEAEKAEKKIYGSLRVNGDFTLKGIVPEGYEIIPFELSDDAYISRFINDDPARPQMILSVAFDETYGDVEKLNDLDDDALAILEKTFTETDPYADITYDETAFGTRLMVCRTTGEGYDRLDIFTIYRGYFVDFVMMPGAEAPEKKLTEEETALCNLILSELDFVSGIEEEEEDIAGKTYTASITGYDKTARTIDLTLFTVYTLTEWDVVSKDVGDTIHIGDEDVLIESLRYSGEDAVINEEYSLSRTPRGMYTARLLDSPVMKEVKSFTADVPDTVVFLEGVDRKTGEFLQDQLQLTPDDLFSALEAAEQGDIRFDSQNVTVTFDTDGKIDHLAREYTPWQ